MLSANKNSKKVEIEQDQEIESLKEKVALLTKSAEETDKMFSETLIVKLRYEKIIKNIMENERVGLDLTV